MACIIRHHFDFKAGTELSFKLFRCVTFRHDSIFQYAYSIAYIISLFNVLSRNKNSSFLILGDLLDQSPYLLTRSEVQVGRGLIKYDESSIANKCHSYRKLSSGPWRKKSHLFGEFGLNINLLSSFSHTIFYIFLFHYTSKLANKLKVLFSSQLLKQKIVLLAQTNILTEFLDIISQ